VTGRTHGTLAFNGEGSGTWIINAEPHVAMRVKRIFPRIATARTGALSVGATPEVAVDLEWMLDRFPLDIAPDDAARLAAHAAEQRDLDRQVTAIFDGYPLDGEWRDSARTPRWPHQARNADLISVGKRLLITDDLGAGKTYSTLTAFRNPDSLPAVIVVHPHLQTQWLEEAQASWPDLLGHIVATRAYYDPAVAVGRNPDYLIITYSKLADWAQYLAGNVRTLILDEAQEIRNSDTRKHLAAAMIADKATYVIGATATPVTNYGDDIHTLYSVIKPGVLGTRPEFLREWCGISSNGKPRVADPQALGTYLRDLGVMTGVKMPGVDPVRIEQTVDFDEAAYEDALGDAAELARFILNQDTGGQDRFVASGQFEMWMRQATGIAKAPHVAAFVKLLLETVDKVVLWGYHHACFDLWREKLVHYRPVFYTGHESTTQKQAALDRFRLPNSDPRASRVFVMSIRSGSGLNGLQDVCHVGVFGELDWTPAAHAQAVGRLDRPGQEHHPVLAYFLTSDHGADPTMIDTLGIKRQQAEPIENPDLEALTPLMETDASKIRALAIDLLRQRGEPIPDDALDEPEPADEDEPAPPPPVDDDTERPTLF
jgi:hypothetical protein